MEKGKIPPLKKNKSGRALVVAVHDVSPAFFPQLEKIINRLQGIGLSLFVLKVIPNYASSWDLRRHEAFLEWLRNLQKEGCELTLHGLEHIRSSPPLNFYDRLRSRLFCHGEDEFSSLNGEEAKRRLLQGRAILEEVGLSCQGFTAPTWHLSQAAIQAAMETGFLYLTTFSSLVDLRRRQRLFSPACGHQGISPFLETLASWGNGLSRVFLLPHLHLIRVVFHPRGIEHPGFERALRLVVWLLPLARATTFSRFLEEG